MSSPEERRPIPPRPEEGGVLGWVRAIALGIGDTAKDVLDAGRQGAREAHDEAWQRFEAKTKHRRAAKRPKG